MKNAFVLSLSIFALVLLPFAAQAQYQILHGTFGSGGGVRSGGGYITYDTAGQMAIGITTGPANMVKAGFWYAAGISSTVDVAITSFYAELKDDAVLLSWTAATSGSFDGFNIYRSPLTEQEFSRINDSLIPLVRGNSYRDDTALPGQSYLYRIGAVGAQGDSFSQSISIALPPKPTTLYQNYPNPFNPSTSIAFYLPKQQDVAVVIYDVSGGRVRTLFEGTKPVGRHTILWDGKNDSGSQAGSGVYYYRLKAGKDVITKKLVIVR
jgi:hypothetical protein